MGIDLDLIKRRQSGRWGGEINKQMAEARRRDDIDDLLEEVGRQSWREAEQLDKLRKLLEQVRHMEKERQAMQEAGDALVERLNARMSDAQDAAAINAWADL